MVDDDRTDREDETSEEEEAGEDELEEETDHTISILRNIEQEGAQYDVSCQRQKVLNALEEGGPGRGTILHEMVKFDLKKHGIEKRRDRKEDRKKDANGKKIAAPGSVQEVKEKYQTLVKMVLEERPEILEVQDSDDKTVLYVAVDLKKYGFLKLLCEIGQADEYKTSLARSIAILPRGPNNCIHEAISTTKFSDPAIKRKTAQVLIENCDNTALLQPDAQGNTPIHLVLKYENLGSFDKSATRVRSLIESMVDKCPGALIVENKDGMSPFLFLIECRRSAMEDMTKARATRESRAEPPARQERVERAERERMERNDAKEKEAMLLREYEREREKEKLRERIEREKIDFDKDREKEREKDKTRERIEREKLEMEIREKERLHIREARDRKSTRELREHTTALQDPLPSQLAMTRRETGAVATPTSPITRPNREVEFPDRQTSTRAGATERNATRRGDANVKSTRAAARTEGGEGATTKKSTSSKHEKLADAGLDEIKDLYAYIENLIKRVILQNFPLGVASTALYGRVPVFNKQLDFNLIGTTKPLSADKIKDYFYFLSFENILQFVALPKLKAEEPLQIEDHSSNRVRRKPIKDLNKPDHYRQIFDWLRPTVKQVLRIIIEDDLENPHSDETIEEAIKGLQVEEWNWRKYDISSETIISAAGGVRVLHLYTTGNNSVLQGWLAPDGLRKLKKLEKIVIHVKEPQSKRTKENIANFRKRLKENIESDKFELSIDFNSLSALLSEISTEERRNPHVKLEKLFTDIEAGARRKRVDDRSEIQITEEFLEPEDEEHEKINGHRFGPGDRGLVHRWLDSVNKCRAWMNNALPRGKGLRKIKVALIDDGVDASHGKLKGNIKHGISFGTPQANVHNVPTSYYASASGHGTLMASLITFVCPWVELYVAKMDDHSVRSGGAFTAKSAAKAVEWAVEQNVDIISMSWTIDDDEHIRDDLASLNNALMMADKKDILMFCAARDEGIENAGKQPWPAASSMKAIFKIGAAAPTGINSSRVNIKAVDYLVPGTDLREFWQYADLPEMSAVDGSSSATALASGLAALILVILAQDTSGEWKKKSGLYGKLKNIFDSASSGDITYLQVWTLWADAIEERNVVDPEAKAAMLQKFCTKLIEKSRS